MNDERCLNCGLRNPSLWGFSPWLRNLGRDFGFTKFLLGSCALLFVLSLVVERGGVGSGDGSPFSSFAPSGPALFLLGASGAMPIFGYGRWWTVLSAGWLHGNLLHIAFNLLWVRNLVGPVAELYGAGRMIVIYVVGSVAGFAATSAVAAFLPFLPARLAGSPMTIGASAAIFALFGALIYYGRRTGHSALRQQVWGWVAAGILFGFVMPHVDNWAHLGGFGGGYLTGRILDPLTPERPIHVLAAIVLLAMSGAAIALSVWTGLPILARG